MNTRPRPHPRRRWWLWLLIVCTLIALGLGMWRAMQTRQSKQQALQVSTTRDAAVLQVANSEWITLAPTLLALNVPISGSLSAVESAMVKARASGELRGLTVREGDSVTAGQTLAHIDPTETDARFRQSKLQADAAQAQLAIAQRQYDNNLALVQQGFISNTALATSQANLQAAQANHAAARAAQDAAKKQVDDTVVRSPIAGQIARRMVQNGERVNIDTPLVEVVNLDVLEMSAALPVNDSAQIRIGQAAQLRLDANTGQPAPTFAAKVVRISPSASAHNRSVTVYLRLAAVPNVALRPGMYLQGHIETGNVQALAVPLSSVHTDQPEPYLQTVQAGRVVYQTVQLGSQTSRQGETWVAIDGAPPGSAVLLRHVGSLPANTPVQLLEQRTSTADPDRPSKSTTF